MVIIPEQYGQLANSLFRFAHFAANAIEFGYELWNPSFADYAPYFAGVSDDIARRPAGGGGSISGQRGTRSRTLAATRELAVRGVRSRWVRQCIRAFGISVLDITTSHDAVGLDYDLGGREFPERLAAHRVLVAHGWLFRDFANLSRHADRLREIFAPIDAHAENVARLIACIRRDCDVLVGIHIRQGDYRQWQGGRHYYESEAYASIMHQAAALFPNRRLRFLVCSNIAQDPALFNGLDVSFANDHPLEALYSLAQCDYVIGPPSTYSMWASFYGMVPLCVLRAPTAPLTLEDFTIVTR